MSALEQGVLVRVVAPTLSNGAPNPMFGRTGVVLEVRPAMPHPIRVRVAGRAVMFASVELERVLLTVVEQDEVDIEQDVHADETAVPA